MKTKQRFIDHIEIRNNDAVVVLDDGSTLGGLITVGASASVQQISVAYITAYIMNEDTILPDQDDTKH